MGLTPLVDEDMSDAAIQSMTHWVSAIADNIRNPVAGMAAALDIMTRQLELRRYTGQCDEALIDDACQRMRIRFASLHEYVTELVDFGRPMSLQLRLVSVSELIPYMTRDLQQTMQSFGIVAWNLQVADDMKESTVFLDFQRIGAMMRALVRNAMEAAQIASQPTILILMEKCALADIWGMHIHIDDNGTGFDRTLLNRVFDPFFSTKEAGTGLGLSLVRKYVEAHGGRVMLGRAPTLGGARVTVWLPFDGIQPFAFASR